VCERLTRNHECVECRNFARRGYREAQPASEKKEGTYYERNREKCLANMKARREARLLASSFVGLAEAVEGILRSEPPKLLGYSTVIGGMQVISCEDAEMIGMTTYFTGVPCVNGHVCEKFVCNRNCVKCRAARQRMKNRFLTEEEILRRREWSRESWRKHNGEKGFQYWCSLFDKPRKMDDPEYRKRMGRLSGARRQARMESDPAYAEERRAKVKAYQTANREKMRPLKNYHDANRRSLKMNARPPWLSKEDKRRMRDMYAWAKMLGELFDETYHVDHIYPLKHKTLCGLHVPWNLQILPAHVNHKKKNRLPEEFDVHSYVNDNV
jgi:5-methylcytosine-specific restriction endonuclease McrA